MKATTHRVYELLRRNQEQIGNIEPPEAECAFMWECAGEIAAQIVGQRTSKGGTA